MIQEDTKKLKVYYGLELSLHGLHLIVYKVFFYLSYFMQLLKTLF